MSRRVALHWQVRSAVLGPAVTEQIDYPGIALTCHLDGAPTHQTWLPAGDDPDEADDEQLIAALREALLWESAGVVSVGDG